MKFSLTCFLIFGVFILSAQETNSTFLTKKLAVKDSIQIDSVSLNPSYFKLMDKRGTQLDSALYEIDFKRGVLRFKERIEQDSIVVEYLRFPDFLTRTYKELDQEIIVEDNEAFNTLYKLQQSSKQKNFRPFEGLNTSGSISRGVTIGTNQNSVLNSELDLQISGKLSDKVSLRASIQDANIPLQESGYSQRLDEFDQVFIELFSEKWKIRAGDIDLQNRNSFFTNFTKRVQGLAVTADFTHENSKTQAFASGALVRGQFARSQFTAQEGNQGPYKLRGSNGELFVLIVSGSELVYVNGVLVERGENEDYIIDYNAGEIIFNSTFPITSEMRITVDYQFSDRNYSRFVAYTGAIHESEKFRIKAHFFNENDAKNQPLQQNLSTDQIGILSQAGDDQSLMVAPSAVPENFNENRILYRQEIINGTEVFVFSNDPDDELFSVKFSLVGENNGNYVVSTTNTIATIYEYVPPINGIPQGNYEPVVQLIAPTKLQLLSINGEYKPSSKTNFLFELVGSNNDLNLFSSLDDSNNNGFATKGRIDHHIIKKDSSWSLLANVDTDFIQENFQTIERLYNPEFNRDWNLDEPMGNQRFIRSGLNLSHPTKGVASYLYENLNFSENYNGNRHSLAAQLNLGRLILRSQSSTLKATSSLNESEFTRSNNTAVYGYKKGWTGAKFSMEDNIQRNRTTQELTPLSQRFSSYEVFTGIGDSTAIFVELGFRSRVNDSIRLNEVTRVNRSNNYFLKSQLLRNANTNLALYFNYRDLKSEADSIDNEQSLNSRLQYSQKLFKQFIQLNTVFETNSGSLPQQEFTYVEVEPGQGAYTWIDYNGNGIQELEEFEIAQFQDQGSYIRVLLPNQIFIKTHQNRLSQSLIINPLVFTNGSDDNSAFWYKLYNQTSYLIDRKVRRDGNNFNLNPFDSEADDQLGLVLNFRNTLFFNRGKQNYTTAYTYLSNKSRNVLSVGFIRNNLRSHQLDFNHKIRESWLITFQAASDRNESESENFPTKNFEIDAFRINPKLSYLFNDKLRIDAFYQFNNEENTIGDMENLKQQKYGVGFTLTNDQQSAISGEFNYFSNDFEGNANSPVGYQMMDGLQPGTNFTWNLIAQKKITQFLDLNLNYFGRKSESNKAIHTGSIQLRAYF